MRNKTSQPHTFLSKKAPTVLVKLLSKGSFFLFSLSVFVNKVSQTLFYMSNYFWSSVHSTTPWRSDGKPAIYNVLYVTLKKDSTQQSQLTAPEHLYSERDTTQTVSAFNCKVNIIVIDQLYVFIDFSFF